MGDAEGRRKNLVPVGRGRGKYKQMNDGVKLPRSSKVGPGGGSSKGKSKVANLEELDMMHHAAITQIEHCNETSDLPSGRNSFFSHYKNVLLKMTKHGLLHTMLYSGFIVIHCHCQAVLIRS